MSAKPRKRRSKNSWGSTIRFSGPLKKAGQNGHEFFNGLLTFLQTCNGLSSVAGDVTDDIDSVDYQ